MRTHEHIVVPLNIPAHKREVVFIIFTVLVEIQRKLAVYGRDAGANEALNSGGVHTDWRYSVSQWQEKSRGRVAPGTETEELAS
jgi:hypothetical protein